MKPNLVPFKNRLCIHKLSARFYAFHFKSGQFLISSLLISHILNGCFKFINYLIFVKTCSLQKYCNFQSKYLCLDVQVLDRCSTCFAASFFRNAPNCVVLEVYVCEFYAQGVGFSVLYGSLFAPNKVLKSSLL